MVHDAVLEKDPQIVTAFVIAQQEAVSALTAMDPGAVSQLVKNYWKLPPEQGAKVVKDELLFRRGWAWPTEGDARAVLETSKFMADSKQIDLPLSWDQVKHAFAKTAPLVKERISGWAQHRRTPSSPRAVPLICAVRRCGKWTSGRSRAEPMTDGQKPAIGFIGLGTMGAPMARNVLKGGYRMTVFDINPKAVADLAQAGATAAGSPREAAAASDVVITMLPDAPDVERAVLGADGVIEGIRRGGVLIDMSTIDPDTTQRVAAALSERGVSMLDSPVGKTADHAVAGTLTLMVGGDAALLDQMRPILSCMGKDFFHCGAIGMGQAMKLSNNLLASIIGSACNEVLVTGVKAGLKLELMLDVMRTTMAWNNQLAINMPKKAFIGDFEPGFMVKLARKDVRLALALARQSGVEPRIGEAAYAALEAAMSAGMGREGHRRPAVVARTSGGCGCQASARMTSFAGYHRPDGRVGVRNHLLVLSLAG